MSNKVFKEISVIGCGRWGGFLGWYTAGRCAENVLMYGLEKDPSYQALKNTGKNDYITLAPNQHLTTDIVEALKNDFIIVSIGCQNFRDLCKQLAQYDLTGKTFLLAMKGLEANTGKRMTQIFREEIAQSDIDVCVLCGPGHVQDYLKNIPSCVVIDSDDESAKRLVADYINSDLIRVYYGCDLIGNEIGAALKNVIGIAAGILDGLEWQGLKGALMARAPREVGRFIAHFKGDPMTAYGLAHLGDYEATLFSPYSHNRAFGEHLIKGPRFEKLAEGVPTIQAVHHLSSVIEMPICEALYQTIYNNADVHQQMDQLFQRPTRAEF